MVDLQITRPEDLDTEAQVTIADVLTAHAAWTQDAPPQYRHLLDAVAKPAAGA